LFYCFSLPPLVGPSGGCGGRINGSNGAVQNFRSPDSDNDGKYDPYLDCQWLVIGPDFQVLDLTFTTFTLEGNRRSGTGTRRQGDDCPFDFVEVIIATCRIKHFRFVMRHQKFLIRRCLLVYQKEESFSVQTILICLEFCLIFRAPLHIPCLCMNKTSPSSQCSLGASHLQNLFQHEASSAPLALVPL